jgi:hypothetical protein
MIHGCMIGIPEATAIISTTAERTELEGLVHSTKLRPILWAMLLSSTAEGTSEPACYILPITNAATARD